MEVDKYWAPSPRDRSAYAFHLKSSPAEEAARTVLRIDARPLGGADFNPLEFRGIVKAMCVQVHPSPFNRHGGHLYMPVHKLCLHIAERFIESRTAIERTTPESLHCKSITSLRTLWEVLHRRLYGSDSTDPDFTPEEPHEYFGGSECRNNEWEPLNDPSHGLVCFFSIIRVQYH